MQRILSKGGKRKAARNSEGDNGNKIQLKSSESVEVDVESVRPVIRSAPSVDGPDYENIRLHAAVNEKEMKRAVSLGDEAGLESSEVALRPQSLVDVRRIEPARSLDHRDSGIGSMQELSKLAHGKMSKYENITEDSEQVFYDIPASGAVSEVASSQAPNHGLRYPSEQGTIYIFLTISFCKRRLQDNNIKWNM